MQQLWLNGKRVDCIDQLRSVMKEADVEQIEELCLKLLVYLKDGVLQAWLLRHAKNKMMLSSKDRTQALVDAVERLKAMPKGQEANSAQYADLATLCDISGDHFSVNEQNLHKMSKSASRKKAWLRKQGYWKDELFQSVTDWDYVITNRFELDIAVEKLNSRSSKDTAAEIYLCRPEKKEIYSLNLRNMENVTILGVGDPKVMHKRMYDWEKIDAKKCRLVLKDFTLLCNHVPIIIGNNDEKNHFVQKKS